MKADDLRNVTFCQDSTVLFLCGPIFMYVHHAHTVSWRIVKRVLGSLELELRALCEDYVGAGNQTRILCESSPCC